MHASLLDNANININTLWSNCQHPLYHWKSESSRKTSIFSLLTMPKSLTVWITTNCGKFLELGISDYLICLLRNLYANQEAIVRTGHGTIDWFKIGKVHQGCILSLCLFNLYAEYIMRNIRLDEAQAGIKISGRNMRNINNLRYADGTTLMAESEEELNTSWWKWKRRVKKLAKSSTFRKLRSWHLVLSLLGK